MGKKKIYECRPCLQYFSGKVAYNYHVNAHRRTALPVKKSVAPKRAMSYTERVGETPRNAEGESQ